MTVTVFDLPYNNITRKTTDVPPVRIEKGPVMTLVRVKGVTFALTSEELQQLHETLKATSDVRQLTKLLEAYNHSAILDLVGQALTESK